MKYLIKQLFIITFMILLSEPCSAQTVVWGGVSRHAESDDVSSGETRDVVVIVPQNGDAVSVSEELNWDAGASSGQVVENIGASASEYDVDSAKFNDGTNEDPDAAYWRDDIESENGWDAEPDDHVINDNRGSEEAVEPEKPKRKGRARFYAAGVLSNTYHFDNYIGKKNNYSNIFTGMTGSILIGMIKDEFRFGLFQQFGGIWGISIDSGSSDMTRFDAASFFEVREVMRGWGNTKLYFTLGVGFLYNMPHTGAPGIEDYLAVDKRGTNLAFSLKIGFGILWYVADRMAIGVNLDYAAGLDIGSYLRTNFPAEYDESDLKKDMMVTELLQPGFIYLVEF